MSPSRAPEFATHDHHGVPVSLTDLLAESSVLLFFYPFAFSGICGGELRRLADLHTEFLAAGVRPVAMSCDPLFSQRVFADTEGFPFRLLTDFWPHGTISREFGVFNAERGCPIRGSFLIRRDSTIAWSVMNPIGQARDLDQHLTVARNQT